MPTEEKWYIADLVMEITVSGDSRNIAHRNLVLIRANSAEEAYDKAMVFGRQAETSYDNPRGMLVQIGFRGIAELEEMYEPLEDGSELTFKEHIAVSQAELSNWILPKDQLMVFRPPRKSRGPDYGSREVLDELAKKYRASFSDNDDG